MNLVAYLSFEGKCEEATRFYCEVLGGTGYNIDIYKNAPIECPEEYKEKVLHGEFVFNGNKIFFSDSFPGQKVVFGDSVSLTLEIFDEETLVRVYEQLSEGGKIIMPLQDTFWGAKFGSFADKYGIVWSLNFQKS